MKVWDYESAKGDKSIVMTKPSMAKYLISTIEFLDGDVVLEPCRGDCAFYDNFPINVEKEFCEINEGKDFLEYENEVDYVISNPPFVPRKLFWSFNQKAMKITRKKIYWLINLSSLNVFTTKRLKEMREQGWFINSMRIVNDKRWFGRYAFIEISKDNNNFVTFNTVTF
ncbi:MAG: hypothetical protein CMJ25_28170 [Phycisphaerae bacterium]|nr:hypothetical protein [Phycisphaerae bacterium]|tara:strand:- start:535 stop:1041 length:507 start_codon:yes stop_codon:yes gene_type:complete